MTDEIASFFNDIEKELRNLEEVASIKKESVDRVNFNHESRVYLVYIKSSFLDEGSVKELRKTIEDRIPCTKVEKKKNFFRMETAYDSKYGVNYL